jgi:hypothetical protein
VRRGLALGVLLFTSCTRATSFNIVGSFFPAWLVCLIVAVLLTAITGWLLLPLHVPNTLLKELNVLSAIFNFAIEEEIVTHNPVLAVRRKKRPAFSEYAGREARSIFSK